MTNTDPPKLALQITEPAAGAAWDLSKTNTIKWTSVETDAKEFALVLVDKSTTPETQLRIADKVATSAGQYELTNFAVAGFKTASDKYSVKALSVDAKNTGQLAESQAFNVTKSGGTEIFFSCCVTCFGEMAER